MESTERRSTTELPKHADIRTCWDKVKPGIVDILKDNPLLTFIPEDVYSECVNERAFLYTSSVGFLVLTVEVDTFTKDKTLLLWIAYTYSKGSGQWLDHEDWITKLAKGSECKYIEAQSHVPELEPYAISRGWNLDTRVYRRKVE